MGRKKATKSKKVIVKFDSSELEIEEKVLVQKTPAIVGKKAYVRPFLFEDDEIETYDGEYKKVLLKKKDYHYKLPGADRLPRGASVLIWKMCVASKVAQTQPYILKYIGMNGVRCKLCGNTIVWAAKCQWEDRFYNRATQKQESRLFVISHVCEGCLKGTHTSYLHFANWIDIILSKRASAQFESLGNAKDYHCALCDDHESDSTWLHIPWNKLMLNVAVCEKHFDVLVARVEGEALNSIDFAKQLVSEGNLSASTLKSMQMFKRVRN